MAHMIPETEPGGEPGATAERLVYQALREQLSDEFFVYHGISYLSRSKALEGEVDFLVLHRELGMLVLECKGFGVRRTGTGQWVREWNGAEVPMKRSPFDQASRHTRDLVAELERRAASALPELGAPFPLVFGHAVVFPFARVADAALPLEADQWMVFGESDVAALGSKVIGAMRAWRGQRPPPRPLEPRLFKRLRKQVVHPALRLAISLGTRLRVGRELLVQLSEQQIDVLKGMLHNRRMRIEGGAGTGKTVLALELARSFAAEGKSVLLMCFNRALAQHLDRLAQDVDGGPQRILARSFHQLCHQAFGLLGEEPVYPERGDAKAFAFWNYEAPLKLQEAIEEGKLEGWDAVIVDEAQDMRGDWWEIIEGCLRDRAAGSIAAFYDPAQAIFRETCGVPEYEARFELRVNFRNTRQITRTLGALLGEEIHSHRQCPEGEPVQSIAQERPAKAVRQLENLVGKLAADGVPPEAIAILTPHSRPNSLLAGRTTLAGLPLAADPLDRSGALLHCSIGRFKGLESDVVILADVDPTDERCGRNERYVAASRARQLLHVLHKGDWLA